MLSMTGQGWWMMSSNVRLGLESTERLLFSDETPRFASLFGDERWTTFARVWDRSCIWRGDSLAVESLRFPDIGLAETRFLSARSVWKANLTRWFLKSC